MKGEATKQTSEINANAFFASRSLIEKSDVAPACAIIIFLL